MNEFYLAEYNQLRQEIKMRAKLLHQNILTAIWFLFISLFICVLLLSTGALTPTFESFALFAPVIFALLTFNYQSNQATMEAVAKYLQTDFKKSAQIENNILGWEDFFGQYKKSMRMTSVLKTVPLWLPLVTPFFIWYFDRSIFSGFTAFLFWLDIVLILLVIYNFRYKLNK